MEYSNVNSSWSSFAASVAEFVVTAPDANALLMLRGLKCGGGGSALGDSMSVFVSSLSLSAQMLQMTCDV